MSEELREPDLAALEAALGALAPAAGGLNRDQLLFRAGQASVRRGWGWPCATGVMTGAAAVLGAILVLRPAPQGVQATHYVLVERPASESSAVVSDPAASRGSTLPPATTGEPQHLQTSYFKLQNQVLRWGLDALPSPPAPATAEPPLTLNQLLGNPPPVPETPSWFDRLLKRGEQS
jgi:hypothetical protein